MHTTLPVLPAAWTRFIVACAMLVMTGAAAAQQAIAFEGVTPGMSRSDALQAVAGTTCYVHSDGRRIDAEICELPEAGPGDTLFSGTGAKRAFHVRDGRVSVLSALVSEAAARKLVDAVAERLGRFEPFESPSAKRAGKQGVALIWNTPTQRVAFDLHPTASGEFLLMVYPAR
ncbi:MAG: hypothetical protein EOO30_13195 [Comamonadaceae bacterium]|nr:MAG: hypothetical protein EOO30_13195 [Comamonadaceae bacterium]